MKYDWEEHRLYKTLGIEAGASIDEIKSAYRKLAKIYHPDITKNPETGPYFNRIVSAYKELSVKETKRKYINFPARENRKWKWEQKEEPDILSLGRTVLQGRTPEMRAFAARRLGFSGLKSTYAYLRKALHDESELVVCAAVKSIGYLRIQQSSAELSLTFSKGSDKIKLSVLEAIERMPGSGGFSNILVMGMRDPDPRIRSKALSVFSLTG